MLRLITLVVITLLMAACAQQRTVYGNGFSFANYDYVVVAKPGDERPTSLYGMDVEFANLVSRYNMRVIGSREYSQLQLAQQQRTLFARMALSASDKNVVVSISFDDALTDRTMASFTANKRGDIYDNDDRGKVFEQVSKPIIKALESEKGLTVRDSKS